MIETRHDWQTNEVLALFDLPFNDLLFLAQTSHRKVFNPNRIQVSTLLSIKTGKCPEDCAYCPQSIRYDTGLSVEELLSVQEVKDKAKLAKQNGSTRFCMGAAWRRPKNRDLDVIEAMIDAVKQEGMETCMTLGMLDGDQALRLKHAGLDYYNHNIDTSPEFYGEVITTRDFEDRLATLAHVRQSGIKVCSGGIIGMGESRKDRARMLLSLSNLPQHPQSVPINQLVKVVGTPLENTQALEPLEFVRTVAVARIMMPEALVRLSAGRTDMSDELQALCYFAGANSIFYGERLLTTPNPGEDRDRQLLARLGLQMSTEKESVRHTSEA
ncbi:MAG: biotin synthase BioB [bacterium]